MIATVSNLLNRAFVSAIDIFTSFAGKIDGFFEGLIAALTITLVWRFVLSPIFGGSLFSASGSSDRANMSRPQRSPSKADKTAYRSIT